MRRRDPPFLPLPPPPPPPLPPLLGFPPLAFWVSNMRRQGGRGVQLISNPVKRVQMNAKNSGLQASDQACKAHAHWAQTKSSAELLSEPIPKTMSLARYVRDA